MIRAYLFALDPTQAQEQAFQSHCGAKNKAFNWGLVQVQANLGQREAERSYGIPDHQLTPTLSWSAYSLRKAWNQAKDQVAPWWAENSKEAYSSGLADLSTALTNWRDSKSGKRKGPKMQFPTRKRRHGSRRSCRFTTGTFGLGVDRRHVVLPRIGAVRTHESTRKLARRVEAGTARIRSATLSHQQGRWHVSFSVEVPDPATPPAPRAGGRVVGVDLGIKSLAALSTGEHIPNRRRSDQARKALRRANRRLARRQGPRPGVDPSNRWLKAKTRVQRVHARVVNLRRNDQHQLTTRLVAEFDTVVVENLHIAGMKRNRRLARQISDAGWYEIRRQLGYKAEQAGVRLVVADRWFPSSKTCSRCGVAKAKLRLAEREYHCHTCGARMDRDHNAAANLAALAAADPGELRREQPEGTGVRPRTLGCEAVRLPREEPQAQRHHRKAVATSPVCLPERTER